MIQESHMKRFSNSLQLWFSATVPYELEEDIRVDYVVQIILQAGEVETNSRWILNKPSISIFHLHLSTQKPILAFLVQSLKKVLIAI